MDKLIIQLNHSKKQPEMEVSSIKYQELVSCRKESFFGLLPATKFLFVGPPLPDALFIGLLLLEVEVSLQTKIILGLGLRFGI